MTEKPKIPKEEDVILRKDDHYYVKDAKVAFTGISEDFFENNQLKLRGNYKDGKLHGLYTMFYENGQLKFKGNYKHGKEYGFYEWYHKNGRLHSKQRLSLIHI